ncbi:Arginyl-tRNA--protein transferase 1 [Lithohypha guttulata]|uniref:Arginyl-tRNA--protein transferase 1 n=1 Tax=Lithohypha guttulata TaxID=1690604 RepID=A0AAN7Y3S0_9EURO|nr:Arginyl-tRNA--protein transferase 1 [Lithohypha guttulata]
MATGISILKPLGYQRSKQCGYCKTDNGNSSYYMSCDNMRIDHYQELMDRGWRRSGTTYYKPDLSRSCCPHYTIRLKGADFKAKKEQRSAINKLNDFVLGPEYKRKAAMLCPQSRDAKRQKRDKFDVTEAAHRAEYSRLPRPEGKRTGKSIEPAHKFEVTLEGDSCTQEKHEVMLRYQTKIHKDPESRWTEASFQRFLCNGLNRQTLKIKGKTMKLGSYHQCYRLDGKLVAVGVLDLMPHAVSSVYLFYDPDYQGWDWGKISALHEIAFTLEKGYQYYYMGYYIHTIPKMRYKGRFEPSFLLDPESLEWHSLDNEFRQKLDIRKYVSVSADQKTATSVDAIRLLVQDASPEQHKSYQPHKKESSSKGDSDYEVDSDISDIDDTDIPQGSLFDYNMPGILTKKEMKKLEPNLGHMGLLVRTSLVELEDIRGWEDWKIDEPNTIKGIAAELIAATGPKLLEDSALALF